VITHALVHRVGIDAVEDFLPGHENFFPPKNSLLPLYQLLNILDPRRTYDPRLVLPHGVDRDGLRTFSEVFRGMSRIHHAVVHQPKIAHDDLNRIMTDFATGLQDEEGGVQFIPLVHWLHENHPEYLRTGNHKKLVESSVEFPWDQFFRHVVESSESGREQD